MPQDTAARFPTHVAIIVDGNRRWAKQRLMPVSTGGRRCRLGTVWRRCPEYARGRGRG